MVSKMVALSRIVAFIGLCVLSFALAPVAIGQVIGQIEISDQEHGYLGHPTLLRIEFAEENTTVHRTAWVYWQEEVESTRMLANGKEEVTKRWVAKPKFRTTSCKIILDSYQCRDLENNRITTKRAKEELASGAIGILNWPDKELPSIYQSVFSDRCLLMTHLQRDSLTEQQLATLQNPDYRVNNNWSGMKGVGEEGYYERPIFFKDIRFENAKLKVTSVSWSGKCVPPEKRIVRGEEVAWPPYVINSVRERKRSYEVDRLTFRTPTGTQIDSMTAVAELTKPDTVAIYLPRGRELHPDWKIALKDEVVIVSRAGKKSSSKPR